MQSYPKTAVKRDLHLWKAQSTASEHFLRADGENTTSPWLQAFCTFPILITGETLPLGPAMITHFRRTTSSFSPTWVTSRVAQGLRITDMTSCQGTNQSTKWSTNQRGRIKTQEHWEWGSSKNKLTRRNLHTAHLQRDTLPQMVPLWYLQKVIFLSSTRAACPQECCFPLLALLPSTTGNFPWLREFDSKKEMSPLS